MKRGLVHRATDPTGAAPPARELWPFTVLSAVLLAAHAFASTASAVPGKSEREALTAAPNPRAQQEMRRSSDSIAWETSPDDVGTAGYCSTRAHSSATTLDCTPPPPPASSIYWGAWIEGDETYGPSYVDAPWGLNTWDLFEQHAGKKVSILHYGQPPPWEQAFAPGPANSVVSRGAIPLMDMSSKDVPLRDVANGVYDSSLTAWANAAKGWGKPFYLRWNWEMNGTWFPWGAQATSDPAAFVQSWRRFHDIVSAQGATNVTWVWCPNLDFPGSTALESLYPGDAYVDWTCLDPYNQGTSSVPFADLFRGTYDHLLQIAPSKPMMIGETSSYEYGGAKAQWITDALASLSSSFPKVRAYVWFNWRDTWNGVRRDWPIESSSSAQAAFAAGIASPYFKGPVGSLPFGKVPAP